jgi:hypothetical protein
MKKLIPCFLLLFATTAQAQSFEGTIKWSMKMEITDPAMKAKMEEGKQKMNDPGMQAKIREMQAKMNDPQMKAAMDANPQMKAQMENTMKMMAGGDMSSMMPKGFLIELKDGNAITKMEGGPMGNMEVLYLKDKDMSYRLDRQNKTYSVLDAGKGSQEPTSTPPKVTKTSETTKILNYTCTKYLVEYTEGGHTLNQSIWTTTDIKDIDLKSMSKNKMGRGHSIYFEGLDGVPLRSEMVTPQGNMSMECTEIKRGGLSASDFIIPPDFKENQGTFGKY